MTRDEILKIAQEHGWIENGRSVGKPWLLWLQRGEGPGARICVWVEFDGGGDIISAEEGGMGRATHRLPRSHIKTCLTQYERTA